MELTSLLAQWHCWRRAYSHERSYSKAALLQRMDHDEELRDERMRLVENAVQQLSRLEQIAVQHYARAQAMGVEVLVHPQLANIDLRNATVAQAVQRLERQLLQAGVISP